MGLPQSGHLTQRPSVRTVRSDSLTISLSSRLNQLIAPQFSAIRPGKPNRYADSLVLAAAKPDTAICDGDNSDCSSLRICTVIIQARCMAPADIRPPVVQPTNRGLGLPPQARPGA